MVLLRACPILKLIQPMVHPDSRLRHGRFRNFPLSFTFLTDVCWTEILQEKRHFIRSNFGYPHLVTILTAYATWKWILKHFKNIILREHSSLKKNWIFRNFILRSNRPLTLGKRPWWACLWLDYPWYMSQGSWIAICSIIESIEWVVLKSKKLSMDCNPTIPLLC